MHPSEFDEVVDSQIAMCIDVLSDKSQEYATGSDKLHNFKVAAELHGADQKKALAGMMAKHTVSIYDMLNSNIAYPMEVWEEKIGDHINYLLILKAILVEEASEDMVFEEQVVPIKHIEDSLPPRLREKMEERRAD